MASFIRVEKAVFKSMLASSRFSAEVTLNNMLILLAEAVSDSFLKFP